MTAARLITTTTRNPYLDQAPPTPAPAPVPDEIASSLRQQLKEQDEGSSCSSPAQSVSSRVPAKPKSASEEKEDVEAAYRAKIDALKRDLQDGLGSAESSNHVMFTHPDYFSGQSLSSFQVHKHHQS